MIDREVNVLLTKAAQIDPRMKRVDLAEQADMAEAWAMVLADISLDDAIAALVAHYRTSKDAITPADIAARAGVVDDPHADIHDVTAEIEAESKARVAAAAGVSVEELDAAIARRDIAWLEARIPRQIEASTDREGWL